MIAKLRVKIHNIWVHIFAGEEHLENANRTEWALNVYGQFSTDCLDVIGTVKKLLKNLIEFSLILANANVILRQVINRNRLRCIRRRSTRPVEVDRFDELLVEFRAKVVAARATKVGVTLNTNLCVCDEFEFKILRLKLKKIWRIGATRQWKWRCRHRWKILLLYATVDKKWSRRQTKPPTWS